MINPNYIGPTRAFCQTDVTKAIKETANLAGVSVSEARDIIWPSYTDDINDRRLPAAFIDLHTRSVAGVAAWAPVLTDVAIQVLPAAGDQALITVVGHTVSGPRLAVWDIVTDWPLETILGELVITPDELAAIAAEVRSADALAGAR